MNHAKIDALSKVYKPIIVLALLLLLSSTAHAEWKSISVPGGASGNTWVVSGQFGDSQQGANTVYFQDLHGRGYSRAGGTHLVSETYVSTYGSGILNMPGSGPTIGTFGYVTTRHYFKVDPFSNPIIDYTSHDGSHSTSSCFYGC